MFWNRTRQLSGRPICQFLLMTYSSAHKCSGTPCQVRIEHRAASHFLVTDVIYEVGPATRLLRELRSRSVDLPVIAAFAPFGDPKAITRLIHEVPGAALASGQALREPPPATSRPTPFPLCSGCWPPNGSRFGGRPCQARPPPTAAWPPRTWWAEPAWRTY